MRQVMYAAFCEALNGLKPGWGLDGGMIVGPEGAQVRLTNQYEHGSDQHIDIEFRFPNWRAGLWDCVVGVGEAPLDIARSAARLWSSTAGGALLELAYSRLGEFADHYRGADEGGLRGWHVISGAIVGWGSGQAPARLQEWWLRNSVLPPISYVLNQSLVESACPQAVKVLFGGSGVAEVRVNGDRHDAASAVLAGLDWPRIEPAGFVRSYFLVLHRDE